MSEQSAWRYAALHITQQRRVMYLPPQRCKGHDGCKCARRQSIQPQPEHARCGLSLSGTTATPRVDQRHRFLCVSRDCRNCRCRLCSLCWCRRDVFSCTRRSMSVIVESAGEAQQCRRLEPQPSTAADLDIKLARETRTRVRQPVPLLQLTASKVHWHGHSNHS